MSKLKEKDLYMLTFIIITLAIISSSIGLFYETGGKAFYFINQYGSKIKMYGNGLYARDSYFKATIFRGTDFTIFCVAVPMLIAALAFDIKKRTLKSSLFLTSVISVFTYYSASLVFGVTYNKLILIYIGLFSSSVISLIGSMTRIDIKSEDMIENDFPYKGIYLFLVLSGVSLIAAWLPDIVSSWINNSSLEKIESYTTEITYALDMGIVAPVMFICLSQLKRRSSFSYILLGSILTLCIVIGVMLPAQTVFQLSSGIKLSTGELVTKMGTFVILALFALYFNIKLFKSIK